MSSDSCSTLQLRYSFSSCTGDIEEERYINRYKIDIYLIRFDKITEKELPPILIGKANVLLFLWELCIEKGYWSDDLFAQIALRELGELLFDHNINNFRNEWRDILDDSFSNNILYIDRIELLPEHRGKGYGRFITKDILQRLYGAFGIAILKAFPLQLENANSRQEKEWAKKMNYKLLEQDEKVATKQLYAFYRKIGFKRYKRSEYFYLNPYEYNPRFEKIHLDD